MSEERFYCPVEDCARAKRPYKTEKGLDSHLKSVHGWTDAQIWDQIKKENAEGVPCPEPGCHYIADFEHDLDTHLVNSHEWTAGKVIARIRKHRPETAAPSSAAGVGSPPVPDGEGEGVASTEAPPTIFDPAAFKEEVIAGVVAELGKFGAKMDARLGPLEEFQGLLDQTLRGAPQPGAQAPPAAATHPPGAPPGAPPGQLRDLIDAAKAVGLVEGPKSGLENLAATLQTARLIANAMNPPSAWDGVQDAIMIRILSRQGLLSDAEVTKLKQDT